MLILNPEVVRFEEWVWEDVAAAAVSRGASRRVEEWGDHGPHAELIDVAEIRTVARVTRRVAGGDISMPTPGALGTLVMYSAPGPSDAGRKQITLRCVLVSVRSELPSGRGATRDLRVPGAGSVGTQVLTFLAVGTSGASDPLSVREAGGFE